MLNFEQRIKMLDRLSLILEYLPVSNSIRDISIKTNIPTSTIQVYLHNNKLISELLGIDIKSCEYEEFRRVVDLWLVKAKKEGPKYGNQVLNRKYRTRSNI